MQSENLLKSAFRFANLFHPRANHANISNNVETVFQFLIVATTFSFFSMYFFPQLL